jgi:hypothetical protein
MKRVFLLSYLKIIILIFFITSAQSEGIKWKGKGSKETDNYIQLFNKGFKETYIDGNLTKYNIKYSETFPNKKKKLNQKNWECRKWTIEEMNSDKNYFYKTYSLNDCLPCLDKGSGYLCSYPYFRMKFVSSSYNKILLEKEIDEYLEFMDDGTHYIKLFINLSSREQIEIVKRKRKKSNKILVATRVMKYNTKYRQIKSETSRFKTFDDILDYKVFDLTFDRLIENVNLAIKNKSKVIIREKDIKNIISIEPGADKLKFQTRD